MKSIVLIGREPEYVGFHLTEFEDKIIVGYHRMMSHIELIEAHERVLDGDDCSVCGAVWVRDAFGDRTMYEPDDCPSYLAWNEDFEMRMNLKKACPGEYFTETLGDTLHSGFIVSGLEW